MAEDKTKDKKLQIDLTNLDLGAAPAGRKPPEAAGKIVFHCSNGHRIVVSEDLAGKRAKCSKCGVGVNIPRGSRPAVDVQAGVAVAPENAEAPAPVEEGPAAAVGESPVGWGQPAAVEEPGGQGVPSGSQAGLFSGIADAADGQDSAAAFIELSATGQGVSAAVSAPISAGPPHSNAALVARLFEEMQQGGIVELHVDGGSVILPEFYDPHWSTDSLGLFASRAADGTVTLTAVAWEAIQKIVVRQVEGLPDGMFE